MSTIVGIATTDVTCIEKTLEVNYKWTSPESPFYTYFGLMKQKNEKLITSEKIRFQTEFLTSTNHYIQFYITTSDWVTYFKVHLDEPKMRIPPEYTNLVILTTKITRETEHRAPALELDAGSKHKLINEKYFTGEDFESPERGSTRWFMIIGNASYQDHYNGTQYDALRSFARDVITFEFQFSYRMWSKPIKDVVTFSQGTNAVLVPINSHFLSGKFSDFYIQCEDKSFPTHRLILAHTSDVFAAMFEQPLKEMTEGKLTIEEFKPEVVEQLLRFIYTENVKLEEDVEDLFMIADKYNIIKLKNICESELVNQIDEGNLLHIYHLAKLYNSEKLMDNCYSFFKQNRCDITKTTEDVKLYSEFICQFFSKAE